MLERLADLARASRARVATARAHEPEGRLLARALATPAAPRLDLRAPGFDLIAEFKRRAPSAGALVADPRAEAAAACAAGYVGAGAAAVSILTEPTEFGGSLADLAAAAAAIRAPVLRKDFLVDPYQVLEARAAGAAGVLLIVRLLDPPALSALLAAAREVGVFVLLEAFSASELERIAELAPPPALCAGVNSRDLATLAVDRSRFAALRGALPRHIACVAESGIACAEDAAAVARLGYRAALVGGALLRAADPSTLVARMLEAGRQEARACESA